MNKSLQEIIETAKKALKVLDEDVGKLPVDHITKTAYVSVAGCFDSIILVAEDALSIDPSKDAIDRPERHSIAGHMNDPSPMQQKGYERENSDEI